MDLEISHVEDIYSGRWIKNSSVPDFDKLAYTTSWEGNRINIRVAGTDSITLETDGSFPFDIYIRVNKEFLFDSNLITKFDREIEIVSGLDPSQEYNITITPSYTSWLYIDYFKLSSLKLHGTNPQLLPKQDLPIVEFIGDSISCGYASNHSIATAFTSLLSYQLEIQPVVISQVGICLCDEGTLFAPRGMQSQYFRQGRTWSQIADLDWSFQNEIFAYKPILQVIALGTNDAEQNIPKETFVDTYIQFIQRIFEIHHAPILLLRPLDGNKNLGNGDFGNLVEDVATYAHRDLKLPVTFVDTKNWLNSEFAESERKIHPNDAGHQIIAEKLGPIIETYVKKSRHVEQIDFAFSPTKSLKLEGKHYYSMIFSLLILAVVFLRIFVWRKRKAISGRLYR